MGECISIEESDRRGNNDNFNELLCIANRGRVFAHPCYLKDDGQTERKIPRFWHRAFLKNVYRSLPEIEPSSLIVRITLSTYTLQAPPS